MRIILPQTLLDALQDHAIQSYPEEGAGVILGEVLPDARLAKEILPAENQFETGSRHNRYLIEAKDILKAEQAAENLGLEVIGVFHSHPDHPAQPSEFDLQWALPWYSYLITHVDRHGAVETKSWRLHEDRQSFTHEILEVFPPHSVKELT